MQKLCPKCGKQLNNVKCEATDIHPEGGGRWPGVAYTCPHCNTVIGVQVNPFLLKHDLLGEIKELFHR